MSNSTCAAGKKAKDGTCFSSDSLDIICKAYNEHHRDSVDINLSKKQKLRELIKKIKGHYGIEKQHEWLDIDFIKKLNNSEIKHNTFRPKGPAKMTAWLSTSDINSVMKQYETKHKDFKFFGAVPYDFAELEGFGFTDINFKAIENTTPQIGIVINLDEHDQPGSHWVALYGNLKENKIYYFDSFGKKPGVKVARFVTAILSYIYKKKYQDKFNLNKFMARFKNSDDFDVVYNKVQHQHKNTECGVYSMNFLIRLLGGETFDNISLNPTNDDAMNACRKEYFRNYSE